MSHIACPHTPCVVADCRLAALLVKHTNEVQEEFHKMKDYAYLNTAPMDHQIEGFQQQQEEIFAQLEPVFGNYTTLQVSRLVAGTLSTFFASTSTP